MGIPRLTQDVAPYAQSCILSRSMADASDIKVTRMVIDGPSLVYHVYNAVLRKRCSQIDGQLETCINYLEINECLAQFLRDITNCGVELHAITFDGALPVSKRSTRLERLEKTRQNLDTYRKLQTYNNFTNPVGAGGRNNGCNLRREELQAILWNTSDLASNKQTLIPPPSFMVASAIEYLQKSEWSNITRVVPGEADGYCAAVAVTSFSAILSNDSDLLLYDLGPTGVVVLLRTLEADRFTLEDGPESLKGQCYQPIQLAKLLNVPSILEYGFHRLNNSSSTTSFITQRARGTSSLKNNPAWISFRQEYQDPNSRTLSQPTQQDIVQGLMQKLDPRLAEVFVSLKNSQSLHSYLPIVFEDPTRDSAWSYGLSLRQTAYSVLLHSSTAEDTDSGTDHVIEFARKGVRIAEQHVRALSQASLLERVQQIIDTYDYHFNETMRSTTAPKNHNQPLAQAGHPTIDPNIVVTYHLMAADTVITQRLSNSRFYMPELSNLIPHNNGMFPSSASTIWDNIHFLASIQCTLYSFRMLKQVVSVVQESNTMSNQMEPTLQLLSTRLVNMPDLADLFLDTTSLRNTVLNLKPGIISKGIRNLLQRVDPAYLILLDGNDEKFTKEMEPVSNIKDHTRNESQWTEATSKSKKRAKHTSNQTSSERSNKPRLDQGSQNKQQFNAFALLQNGGDSSDET